MGAVKEIFHSCFILLFVVQITSCGQKEKAIQKEDEMSKMPGMEMGSKDMNHDSINYSVATISMNDIIKPTNKYVLSSLPLTIIRQQINHVDLQFYGFVNYNEKGAEVISSRIAGRIDKLYVKYRFESISKGQKLMEIYSPELVTAEQDLMFLLGNDAQNTSLIELAKQKLLLLGMSEDQLRELIQKKIVKNTITVYSAFSGHIHESGSKPSMNNSGTGMNTSSQVTQALDLKEGMYVEKGQPLFMVYNSANAWILANIFPEQQPYIHKGDIVQINSDIDSTEIFMGKIDFIEPEYREGSKTLTARIYFDNSSLKLPVNSRVKILEKNIIISGFWIPASSILSLGRDKVVLVKSGNGFIAKKIGVNFSAEGKSLISDDFPLKDSIALNAQYLIDSESFIKVK
ncbi:MAG: efflux RND transporter periplasmic adaptor subunit [Bacteroidia bacterium]